MLPSLHNLNTLKLDDGTTPGRNEQQSTGALLPESEPIEQDFTVQEEYDLDLYLFIHTMLHAYQPTHTNTRAMLLERYGFKSSDEKLQRSTDLNTARLARELNEREISPPMLPPDRTTQIQQTMAVASPLGGFKKFYMKVKARCVGVCYDPTTGERYDALNGARDMIAVLYGMPVAPVQKPYAMRNDFCDCGLDIEAFYNEPCSVDVTDHLWARTCNLRMFDPVEKKSSHTKEYADVLLTLDFAETVRRSSTQGGSNNVVDYIKAIDYERPGRITHPAPYGQDAAVEALKKQFKLMDITDPQSLDSTAKIANPGQHLWNVMAKKTNLFMRTSKNGIKLHDAIVEAYNTLHAAVMGLTPPIYQLIIAPFEPNALPSLSNMGVDTALLEAAMWQLVVLSEAAWPAVFGPHLLEKTTTGPSSSATHSNHIDRAQNHFYSRRALSLQTRLAEHGFLMLDNKPENCVIQQCYRPHQAFVKLGSDPNNAIDVKTLIGDVMAVDFDGEYTLLTAIAAEATAFKGPHDEFVGSEDLQMYQNPTSLSIRPVQSINPACIRFINMMIYGMRILCGMNSQRRHMELQYIVAAMTRYTSSSESFIKSKMCQYFFHVSNESRIEGLLAHEKHNDRQRPGGPGYSLKRHHDDKQQTRPSRNWKGGDEQFEDMLEVVTRSFERADAWDWGDQQWMDFWKNTVAQIRERTDHYGLKYVYYDKYSKEVPSVFKCGNIMKQIATDDVETFLRDSLRDVDGSGNWKNSADNAKRTNFMAMLSFPKVVLGLFVMAMELFADNEPREKRFPSLPKSWPAPQPGEKRKQDSES